MLGRQARRTPTLVSTTFHIANGMRLTGIQKKLEVEPLLLRKLRGKYYLYNPDDVAFERR